jgi:phosphomannomutase
LTPQWHFEDYSSLALRGTPARPQERRVITRCRARNARAALLAALLVSSGCAQLMEPSFEPAAEPGSLGALDRDYDRTKWRWVKNVDGRLLLSHTQVPKCFINPQPDQDFNDPGFTLKREEKSIGSGRYEVVNVYDKDQFWEAVYLRSGTTTPLLGVYAEGACRDEAERILDAHEKTLAKQAEK